MYKRGVSINKTLILSLLVCFVLVFCIAATAQNQTTAQCADTVDNDGDSLIDLDDPGCDSAEDDDETDPPPPVLLTGAQLQEEVEQLKAMAGYPVLHRKTVTIQQEGSVIVTTALPKGSDEIDVSTEEGEVIEGEVEVTVNYVTLPVDDYNEQTDIPITGGAVFGTVSGKGLFYRILEFLISLLGVGITGNATYDPATEIALEINDIAEGDTTTYEIFYETPAPEKTETQIDADTKRIVVSSDYAYTDVMVETDIPKTQRQYVRVYYVTDTSKTVLTTGVNYFDTNGDGLIDRVRWVIPHMSEHTYEVETSGSSYSSGGLSIEIDYPTTSIDVVEGDFFDVNATVSCAQGYTCGDVTATLDPTPTMPAMELYMPFEQGCPTGSTPDMSGNGHTGIVYGANCYASGSHDGSGYFNFDGVNDHIDLGSLTRLEEGTAHSISAWVNSRDVTGSAAQTVIASGKGTSWDRVGVVIRSSQLTYGIYNGAAYLTPKSGSVSSNTWHHFVVSYDGTNADLYIDGINQTGTAGPFLSQESAFAIGIDTKLSSKPFNGSIDDVRLYNTALTPEQVQHLYAGEPQCSDGLDNDADIVIDTEDPGCYDSGAYDILDDDETDTLPECSDYFDNDGDIVIDTEDPGCYDSGAYDALDDDETDTLPECSDYFDNDGNGLIDFPADPGCTDASDDDEVDPGLPQCSNGVDDDSDSVIDTEDPGCYDSGAYDALDDDETDTLPECSDYFDNDGDALVDFPADPGCTDASDDNETDPPPQCSDGLDNDGDALIDFPADPGCSDAADDDETNLVWTEQASRWCEGVLSCFATFSNFITPGCELEYATLKTQVRQSDYDGPTEYVEYTRVDGDNVQEICNPGQAAQCSSYYTCLDEYDVDITSYAADDFVQVYIRNSPDVGTGGCSDALGVDVRLLWSETCGSIFNLVQPPSQAAFVTIPITHYITLENIGAYTDSYNIFVFDDGGADTVNVQPTLLDVPSFGSSQFTLEVGDDTVGNYTVTVNVSSQTDPSVSHTVDVTTEVLPLYSFEIPPQPLSQTIYNETTAVYNIFVNNTGGAADTYDIFVEANPNNADTVNVQPTLTVPAETSDSFTVEVGDPVPDIYPVTVNVTSQANSSLSEVVTVTTTIEPTPDYLLATQLVPATHTEVGQDTFFTYKTRVECGGSSPCGDVTATLDPQVIIDFENFEDEVQCGTGCGNGCNLRSDFWTNVDIAGDNIDWTAHRGATGSGGTGPDYDHTTGGFSGYKLYTEASSGCDGRTAAIESNEISLPNVMLSFWYHMYGVDMGSLHVDVYDGISWTQNVWNISGQQHSSTTSAWTEAVVDLSSYTVKKIRIRGFTGPSYISDMAIDDITVTGNTDKGVIPVGSGNPFYTIDPNPVTGGCLQDMQVGDSCNLLWRVKATGAQGLTSSFFVTFDSADPTILDTISETINITISDAPTKTIIPEDAGEPFYTTTPNPTDKDDIGAGYDHSCLANMQGGDTCQLTWRVRATGDLAQYDFFAFADSTTAAAVSDTFNVTILEDTTPPVVTLVSPEDAYITYDPTTIDLNCSATDDIYLKTLALYTDITGSWQLYETRSVSGTSAQEQFTLTDVPYGAFEWNCEAGDTGDNLAFAPQNRIITVVNFPPEVSSLLVSSLPNNDLDLDYTITDLNNDDTKAIINWELDESSITVLNMPFEANATKNNAGDYSGYGNDGTVMNGAVWDKDGGHDGWGAFVFDGSNDHIEVAHSLSLDLVDEVTLSAWVKSDADGFVVVNVPAEPDPIQHEALIFVDQVTYGTLSFSSSSKLSAGWIRVHYDVYRGAAKFSLSSLPPNVQITGVTFHGKAYACAFSHILEIYDLVNDPLTASASTLWSDAKSGVLYDSGSRALDSASYCKPGEWINPINLGPTAASDLQDAMISPGWFGLGFSDHYPTDEGSFYGWDQSSRPYLKVDYTTLPPKEVPFALSTYNGGQFQISSTATISAGGNINDGQWHHLAATYDGSEMRVYVDGVLENTSTDYSGLLPLDTFPVWIGKHYDSANTSGYFNGAIDEVQIYDRVLSAEQIRALNNSRTDLLVAQEQNLAAEEVWKACVTPNDNTYDGARACIIEGVVFDDDAPVVTLVSPADQSVVYGMTVTFTCNATDNVDLSSITLYTDLSGTWEAYETKEVTGTSAEVSFSTGGFSVPNSINWNCRAEDSVANEASAPQNWLVSFENNPPVVDSAILVSSAAGDLTTYYDMSDEDLDATKGIFNWYFSAGGAPVPRCSDGGDNDGDGLTDLADPGCADASDDDETDPLVPLCSDGFDNDGDGMTDLADPGCSSAADDDEAILLEPRCSDGVDNDGDSLTDLADPGCSNAADDDETHVFPPPISEMKLYYPFEQGCPPNEPFNGYVPDESSTYIYDNNGYVDGPDCHEAGGHDGSGYFDFDGIDDEIWAFDDSTLSFEYQMAISVWFKQDSGTQDDRGLIGKSYDGPNFEYTITKHHVPGDPANSGFKFCIAEQFSSYPNCCTDYTEDITDTTNWHHLVAVYGNTYMKIYIDGSLSVNNSCSIDYMGDRVSSFSVGGAYLPGGVHFDVTGWRYFDGQIDEVLVFNKSLTQEEIDYLYNSSQPDCSDGVDNDVDGDTDWPADSGCTDASDIDETIQLVSRCDDGVDNDADGFVDLLDSGCTDASDDDESEPLVPRCSDGFDNDGDALIDFPADLGCTGASDDDERDSPVPRCNDGVDNDADGFIDLLDSGCTDAFDDNEDDAFVLSSIMDLNMPLEAHSGDETQLALDYSDNDYHGTVQGASWDSSGGHDNLWGGYFFNWNWIDLGSPANLPYGDDPRTMCLWAKNYRHSDEAYTFAFSYGNDLCGQASFIGGYYGTLKVGGFCYDHDLSIWEVWFYPFEPRWKHICGVYDGTNVTAYGNGEFLGSEVPLTWNTVQNRAYIGRQVNDGEYWVGPVDDVRVYNRPLSAEQVQAMYDGRDDFIVNQETNSGEVWKACITPIDGMEEGARVCTNELTIGAPLDTVPPTSALVSPANGFSTDQPSVDLTCNATDESALWKIVLYTDLTGTMQPYDTAYVTWQTSAEATFNVTPDYPTLFNWTCKAYDMGANSAFAPETRFVETTGCIDLDSVEGTLLVRGDMVLCPDTYYVNMGDVLPKARFTEGASLDCAGSTIISDGDGTFSFSGVDDTALRDCTLVDFGTALAASKTTPGTPPEDWNVDVEYYEYDRISDILLDQDNNYLAVYDRWDLIRFDKDGTVLSDVNQTWAPTQEPLEAAIDQQGDIVYVSCQSTGMHVAKSDNRGNLLWSNEYTDQDCSYGSPKGVAVDRDGNYIVTLKDKVVKLNPDGYTIQERSTGSCNRLTDIIVDNDGNYFAIGIDGNNTENSEKWCMVKLSPNLIPIWSRTMDLTGGNDRPLRAALSDDNNYIVLGYGAYTYLSTGYWASNWHMEKIDSETSATLWSEIAEGYERYVFYENLASDLAVDTAGNILIGGNIWISDLGARVWHMKAFDTNGNEIWNYTKDWEYYDEPEQIINDILPTPEGDYIVGGLSRRNIYYDLLITLQKLSPNKLPMQNHLYEDITVKGTGAGYLFIKLQDSFMLNMLFDQSSYDLYATDSTNFNGQNIMLQDTEGSIRYNSMDITTHDTLLGTEFGAVSKISISPNNISVGGVGINDFTEPADLTLYDLSFPDPELVYAARDGERCSPGYGSVGGCSAVQNLSTTWWFSTSPGTLGDYSLIEGIALACLNLSDYADNLTLLINEDVQLCQGVYNLTDGPAGLGADQPKIQFSTETNIDYQSGLGDPDDGIITLDCDGSTIISDGNGVFSFSNLSNVSVVNCTLIDFATSLKAIGDFIGAAPPPGAIPISTCEGLQDMELDLTADYALIKDIDCSDTVNWNWDGSKYRGFDPIGFGYDSDYFAGSLDGQDFTISNLYINRPDEDGNGLFGYIGPASISNVGLIDVDITGGYQDGGALAGASNGYSFVYIDDCSATGSVTGTRYIGGLIGRTRSSYISNSYANVTVAGSGNSVGGLVGSVRQNGFISNSYAAGNVTGGGDYVGGLAGKIHVYSGEGADNSYATGAVTGSGTNIGGLVGYLSLTSAGSTLSTSYWWFDNPGGNPVDCIGNHRGMGYVPTDCAGNIGGTVGRVTGPVSYFYDISNPPMHAWNFASIWSSANDDVDYPVLISSPPPITPLPLSNHAYRNIAIKGDGAGYELANLQSSVLQDIIFEQPDFELTATGSSISGSNIEFRNTNGSILYNNLGLTTHSVSPVNMEISNNVIRVESDQISDFNAAAHLTFYDPTEFLGCADISDPEQFFAAKDGVPCVAPECSPLTRSDSTYEYNVTEFTTYSVGAPGVWACLNLNDYDGNFTFLINEDVLLCKDTYSITGLAAAQPKFNFSTEINIPSSCGAGGDPNDGIITLDCDGSTIISDNNGVFSFSNLSNIAVVNCTLVDFATALKAEGSTGGTPPTMPAMVLYMPFEEHAGDENTLTLDVSSSGNDGSVSGASWQMAGGYDGGGAYDFEGVNDIITLNSGISMAGDWTISTWTVFPLDNTGTWRTLSRGSDEDHFVIVNNVGYLGIYDNNGSNWVQCSPQVDTDTLSGWKHLVAVSTGGETLFYIDSQYVCKSSDTGTGLLQYVGNYQVGNQKWGSLLDEFKIFDTALTQEQIDYLYNGTPPAPLSNHLYKNIVIKGDNAGYDFTLVQSSLMQDILFEQPDFELSASDSSITGDNIEFRNTYGSLLYDSLGLTTHSVSPANMEVSDNLIRVESGQIGDFNASAHLKFIDPTLGWGSDPDQAFAVRDGLPCSGYCSGFLQEGTNYSYNVSQFTNYSVGAPEVDNTPPTVTKPEFSLTTVYTDSLLGANTTYSDVDLDVGVVNFSWYVDGASKYNRTFSGVASGSVVTASLSGSNFSRGQTINVSVRAYDGEDYSAYHWSDSITVSNSVPEVDSMSLNATSVLNLTGDNLTLHYATSDADSDSIINITDWRLDSSSIAVLNMPFEKHAASSTTAVDYSTHSNDGALTGHAPTWTSNGHMGGAYEFDGSNDHIEVANSGSTGFADEITLSAWVKSTPGTEGYVIVKEDPSEARSFFDGFESGYLNPGYWGTWLETSDARIQVTGAYGEHTGFYALAMDSLTPTYFEGACVFTTFDMTGATNVDLSYWVKKQFGDYPHLPTSPGPLEDMQDSVAYTCDGYSYSWYTLHRLNDLTTSFVQKTANDIENLCGGTLTSDFSIAFCHHDNSPFPEDGFVFDDISITYLSGPVQELPFALSTVNGGEFKIGNSATVSAGSSINDGAYHHLAATYNGSEMKIYVDGVLKNTSYDYSGQLPSNDDPIWIGRHYDALESSGYFDGIIDEVMIYERQLSAEQILALYNNRTDLIVSQETSVGDVWQACVTPNDGFEDGVTGCSNDLTIVEEAVACLNLNDYDGNFTFLINEDTILCKDTYSITDLGADQPKFNFSTETNIPPQNIGDPNDGIITLDCNGSTIISDNNGVFSFSNLDNVSVVNCTLINFSTALKAEGSTGGTPPTMPSTALEMQFEAHAGDEDVLTLDTSGNGNDGAVHVTSYTKTYLSDIDEAAFSCHNNVIRKDMSHSGGILNITDSGGNGNSYEKALSCHAQWVEGEQNDWRSYINYNLNGEYDRFYAEVGIDDFCDPHTASSNANFRVVADGNVLQLNGNYETGTLGRLNAPYVIDLDITGVNNLSLQIDEADGSINCDHSAWGDAQVLKSTSAWKSSGSHDSSAYYEFDGDDDYIEVADSNSLDIDSNSITLAAWINPTDCTGTGDGRQTVVTKRNAYYLNLESGTCKPAFYWYDLFPTNTYHTSETAVPTGSWSHITAVYDGVADEVIIYIDGIETQKVTPVTGDGRENADTVRIGGYNTNNRNFDGYIDNVRIYDTALTPEQVEYLYDGGSPLSNHLYKNIVVKGDGAGYDFTFVQSSLLQDILFEQPDFELVATDSSIGGQNIEFRNADGSILYDALDITTHSVSPANMEVSDNLIRVESGQIGDFNESAYLEFFNPTLGAGVDPDQAFAVRDGLPCSGAYCSGFLQEGTNYSYNVSQFTNYSVGAPEVVVACLNLSEYAGGLTLLVNEDVVLCRDTYSISGLGADQPKIEFSEELTNIESVTIMGCFHSLIYPIYLL
jgi:hypothetical protein